jgi:alkylhydroperoxidase/carboxymuconolactone decarboxylase family protein YurZ
MSTENKNELESSKLIEKMKSERGGKITETHEYLAKHDVDFGARFDELFALLMTKDTKLPIRTKELITIAILAVKSQYDAVRTHVDRSLKIGVTESEILEALELAMFYGGTEALIQGGKELVKVTKSLAEGKKE